MLIIRNLKDGIYLIKIVALTIYDTPFAEFHKILYMK
jgi:hypothetical protein